MSLSIRPAAEADAAAIRAVMTACFPTPAEADLVDRLRADGDLVSSFLALVENEAAGAILFSRMKVEADGERVSALALAPLGVVPAHRRRGIGGRLVERGLAAANGGGTSILFVLGDPEFYGRFGFRAECAAPFASPYAGPHFLAQWLSSRRSPQSGRASHARAFADLR